MEAYINKIKDKTKISWKKSKKLDISDLSITVKDLNEAEASFTSNSYFDVTDETYIILITDPRFHNYSGIIYNVDYDAENEQYKYKSKDFHFLYNKKISYSYKSATGYDILRDALCWGETKGESTTITTSGKKKKKKKKTNKKVSKYKRQLAGILPKSKYKMAKYGQSDGGNPMKKVYKNQNISAKTCWEVIKAYTVGTGAWLDLEVNDYGTILVKPFRHDEFLKPVAKITDVSPDLSLNFNAEGLIGASGHNSMYQVKLEDLQDTRQEETKTATKKLDTNNTGSWWKCKEKKIALNMDLRTTKSNDQKWLNNVAKELRKLGWKVDVIGVAPGLNVAERYFSRAQNGVYLTIDNGQDSQVLREGANMSYCKGRLQKLNAIWAIFFVGISKASSFLKGGKYYNSLELCHDAVSGAGGGNLKYPAGYLAEAGVPFGFCFTDSAKDMAKLIDKGGDSKLAHDNNFLKNKCRGWNYETSNKNY